MTIPQPPCLVCATASRFFMKKDGFDEYFCPNCGLSFVYPQPSAEWLKERVYSYESGYQGNKKTDLALESVNTRAMKTLNYLERKKPNGKLLDVGCSSGLFMHEARKEGFSCVGTELNKRTADIARSNGFNVYEGFLHDAPFEKESFDVLYLGDVIEHVNDPRELIQQARIFLQEGGILAIDTPNTECWWSRVTLKLYQVLGIPWAVATPPHHLFQFGYSNLTRLVQDEKLIPIHSIFFRPTSLKYELGSLHLYKMYKKFPTIGKLLYTISAFGIYTFVYAANYLTSPLQKKKFHMIIFYEKRSK